MNFYYLKLPNLIMTNILARKVVKEISNDYTIAEYYSLKTPQGVKIINPICDGSSIRLKLPIPDDIITNRKIDQYVNDQKTIIDVIIYEACVGSAFSFNVNNLFTEETNKLVVELVWKVKIKDVLISLFIYAILGFLLFFALKYII